MVNNLDNISAHQAVVPANIASSSHDRRIHGGPLYSKEKVLSVLEAGEQSVFPWTRKCIKDMREKLDIDNAELVDLLKAAITAGKYQNSEWCCSKNPKKWLAADAYVLKHDEWIENAKKHMQIEYYLKFAIAKSGSVILTVSCHNPENR